jgi:hypothetical protein
LNHDTEAQRQERILRGFGKWILRYWVRTDFTQRFEIAFARDTLKGFALADCRGAANGARMSRHSGCGDRESEIVSATNQLALVVYDVGAPTGMGFSVHRRKISQAVEIID